ncbi:branched-chain amino acid ABC transporter permease [Bradyrhizobium diazoefficiens]|uniref:ABC transporter permease protein n=2 Tax=Bradyrhizobium diazoefficiens TaxID=1355477 RepID=Q89GH6_BRADU|nr:branched-chain amino acid ABC transporter permease [Bradyrhizobium diazoefficiens]QBP25120.1 branched-chain amino acid ABC transporter permease [Bradyrhizobium diazoefficiens]WLB36532.1 branched-chain amino acid ABC transporter permease [Bradyrhizobium diazoefficiens]BAC51634.1 ABC transporter permease protein [Bradyrhizobium diazoefficiens USDA 110]BCE76553.1 branched-chain amino acid ABC transporter permease [Bradyrhizobium diazoefficiens]BCF46329.1 branched-chain amino acid ABC transport
MLMSNQEAARSGRLPAVASIAAIALTFVVPWSTENPAIYSLVDQMLIAVTAAFSVFIMLRMNLMTFAVPTFMAIGAYTSALLGLRHGVTDVLILGACSFLVPMLFALPLGALVLRLTGVYFVLVTFVLTEITQLVLFETPGLTGGSNGLVGMPAVTLFGFELGDNRGVLLITIGLALAGALITSAVTLGLRQHFAAIEENELLAQSLGLVVWHYKSFGFAVAAGVAGLAGFALANMLLTAHPTSFSPLSSVNYIAYVIIGGKANMLGPIVGAILLVWAGDAFAFRGEYSQLLFGSLIVLVVLVARDGVLGTLQRVLRSFTSSGASRSRHTASTISTSTVTESRP